jgi:hypothetical protein
MGQTFLSAANAVAEFARIGPTSSDRILANSATSRAMFRAWLLLTLALAGCSTYGQRVEQVRAEFYSNQLAAASAAASEARQKQRAGTDVFQLDQALIELAAGHAAQSEKLLREVRDRFDSLEGPAAGEAALSYLTDDNRRAYSGEDYEKVLIRAFLALGNLLEGGGDAEAYSLQLIDKQEQIVAAAAKPDQENPKANYQRVALAPYLRGVLREATHHDYDDAERSYTSVVSWQPQFQSGRVDLARATSGAHSRPGHGVVYVFALTGRGPHKIEAVEVPSTAALLVAGEIVSAVGQQTVAPNVAPVKVPLVVAQHSRVRTIGVGAGNQPLGTTETITDVTQLAVQQYQAIYPQVIARAIARRCLKKGALYGAKQATGVQKGSLTGLAYDLAGIAWEASESADLRCWSLLPDKIQVLRVELPAGEHDLSLCPLGAANAPLAPAATRRIAIADGCNTYVLANFPDGPLVGQVLVSQP